MISDGELMQMIHEGEELGYSTIVEALVELEAYRKAFSEPVAFTAQSNLDGFCGNVGYMWPPGHEKPTDVALYRKPTIPE